MSIHKLVLVPVFAFAAMTMVAQSSQKLTGTVTDSMCGKKHMMQGATAAQCTRACIKSGAGYALVSDGKVYVLKGDKAQFDKFAGANVVIEGETSGDTVTVKTIKAAS
jgi:ribosomal protein L19